MKIVIDIPKKIYECCQREACKEPVRNGKILYMTVWEAVGKGKPVVDSNYSNLIDLGPHELNKNVHIFECSGCHTKMAMPLSERPRYCMSCGRRYVQSDIYTANMCTTQDRRCDNCEHSSDGNINDTETCHECMWDSKYEPKRW